MRSLSLQDSVSLVALYAAECDPKYDRAAARLLARIANERPELRLSELQLAAAILTDLRHEPSRTAMLHALLHD
jgi:hypothetical protein